MNQIKRNAFNGDSEAQLRLACMYYYGNKIRPSVRKAIEWYEKSAMQGNDEARLKLATIYYDGRGVS